MEGIIESILRLLIICFFSLRINLRAVLLCTLMRASVPMYITISFNFTDSRTITNLTNAFNCKKAENWGSDFIFDPWSLVSLSAFKCTFLYEDGVSLESFFPSIRYLLPVGKFSVQFPHCLLFLINLRQKVVFTTHSSSPLSLTQNVQKKLGNLK